MEQTSMIAIVALALLVACPPTDVIAAGCHSCCLCNDVHQIKIGIQEIHSKSGNCTDADSRTDILLTEQEKLILRLQKNLVDIKTMVESLTEEARLTSPMPTPTSASPRPPAPSVGVAVPGAPSRFRFVKEMKTWNDSEATCKKAGGHLATFTDLDEWNSVMVPFFKMKANGGWDGWYVWLGGKGLGRGGEETWSGEGYVQVDGSPLPFHWGKKTLNDAEATSKKAGGHLNFPNFGKKWRRRSGPRPWIRGFPHYDDDDSCLVVMDNSGEPDDALLGTRCHGHYLWFLCKF